MLDVDVCAAYTPSGELNLAFGRMQADAAAADCCLRGCDSHSEHEFVAAIVVTTYIFFK